MKLAWMAMAAALPAFAVVSGTVTNGTTGKPQANVKVTLFKVGGGMEALKTVQSDAEGKFSIDVAPKGPALVQTEWEGVTYNTMVPPGTASTGLTPTVFDVTKQAGTAKVSQHMVLIEPGEALQVSESLFINNDTKSAFSDPTAGTLRFYLPEAANGDVQVTINEPQALIPLQRPAEKTSTPNVYKVNYPIKPGETRFDITYRLPKADTFASRVLHKEGATRIVVPKGVTLAAQSITSVGTEPRTQATIYDLKAADYKVTITGTGSLRPAQDAAAASGGSDDSDDSGGATIARIQSPVNEKRWVIIPLGLGILMLGFVLLYRSSVVALEKRAARK